MFSFVIKFCEDVFLRFLLLVSDNQSSREIFACSRFATGQNRKKLDERKHFLFYSSAV